MQALDYRPVPGFERAEIGVKLVIEVDSFTVFAWSVLLFLRKKNVLDILVEFQPEVKRSVPQSLNESQHGCRQQLLVSLWAYLLALKPLCQFFHVQIFNPCVLILDGFSDDLKILFNAMLLKERVPSLEDVIQFLDHLRSVGICRFQHLNAKLQDLHFLDDVMGDFVTWVFGFVSGDESFDVYG